MFLKSLTLKGFKSFADKTTLEFEPGVCVVVGPNGSGKSNIVDSVAWVLGAQGARALRGGKMDDVIFAGTADRPALGRAEVSLTIDNTAGLLPIEFSEVTITRTLFRTGDSEYLINGAPCRLLDIQELLSDTGIGRQQHVIVGQGQLDTVLNARPEDRRAIIEEAAGILKFRKRREKAQRRLEATEGNLLRLTDLLREVRRQLRPLERQADAARRHDGLVAELQRSRCTSPAARSTRCVRARSGAATQRARAAHDRNKTCASGCAASTPTCSTPSTRSRSPATTTSPTSCTRTEALRERGARSRRTSSPNASAGSTASSPPSPTKASSRRWSPKPRRCASSSRRSTPTSPRSRRPGPRSRRPSSASPSSGACSRRGDAEAVTADVDAISRAARTRGATTVDRPSSPQTPRATRGRGRAELYALAPRDGRGRKRGGRRPTRAASWKSMHDAQVAPDMTAGGAARRAPPKKRCTTPTRAWRDAEADASRWRRAAPRRSRSRSTQSTRRPVATRSPTSTASSARSSTTSRSSAGAEVAVAAALGDALQAIVVEGDDRGRATRSSG